MFSLFMPTEKTSYTRNEAIRKIKRLLNSGARNSLHEFAGVYSDDFEDVFREALGEMAIETYGYGTESEIVRGRDSMGVTTNNYQKNLWDFMIYSLVLFMRDNKRYIPVSALDNVVIDRINQASRDFGYRDVYKEHNPLEICLNPCKKPNYDKAAYTEEDVELMKKARKEIEEYIAVIDKRNEEQSAEFFASLAEDEDEEINPWRAVHEKMCEDDGDDEE